MTLLELDRPACTANFHASDCATYSEPAEPADECDCGPVDRLMQHLYGCGESAAADFIGDMVVGFRQMEDISRMYQDAYERAVAEREALRSGSHDDNAIERCAQLCDQANQYWTADQIRLLKTKRPSRWWHIRRFNNDDLLLGGALGVCATYLMLWLAGGLPL